MTPIELQSRREALGLSQAQLASLLSVQQPTVARWESGARKLPAGLSDALAQHEEVVEQLIEDAEELLNEAAGALVTLAVYGADADLWAAHPEMLGVPAVLHRVAMARVRSAADGPCVLIAG